MSSPARDVRRLVVRAPNWVGDVVMATPVLEAALADPRFERVDVAVRAHLAPLLGGPAYDGRVVTLGRGREETAALSTLGADAALLLSSSPGAAWRAWRAGIRVRAGASLGGRAPLLTHRVVPPTRDGRRAPIPTQHLQRDVAGLLGILVPSLAPRLHVEPSAREAARRDLEEEGLSPGAPYLLCAPGAAFGAAKLWPPEHFAAALDRLADSRGLRSVVTGGPGEEPLIDAVAAASRHGAVSLAHRRRDLPSLAALVEGASLVLVGDSGPRWVAAALGVPCVVVMGPNSPELTASSLGTTEIVRRGDLACAPCLRRRCPLGHHACLRGLAPERVVEAAERLLGAGRAA